MRFLIPALLFFAATAHAEEAMCPQLDYELAAPQAPEEGKLVLSADRVLMEQDGLSSLAGAVKLMQDDKQFIANALDFDSATRTVRIGAESLFRNEGLIIKSQSAVFDLNAETGVFQQPQFTLPSRAARGKADSITLSGQGTAELAGVRYTTCAPDSQAWDIAAENIELDPEEGLGTARNARLRLGNVPVLYLPYFQFPIDDRRRTGLLFPTTGGTNQTGFDLRLPIYLNLAPNYDATLTPRYMARRGVQLGGDTRYLYTRGEGDAHVEWLPKDEITDEARTYFQTDHQGLFNRRLGYQLDYGHASDQGYFEDLGGSTDLSSITHLERRAQLTYQAPAAYTIRVLAQDYQTISRTVLAADEPYARLPQVVLTARTKKTRYLSRAGITGEFVSFARELSLEGQRVDLDPYIRTEKQSAAWYLASQTNLRYTAYQLSGPVSIVDRTPSRSLPQFSAEGGLRFERVTNGGQLQTLEPYVFYLYTPCPCSTAVCRISTTPNSSPATA